MVDQKKSIVKVIAQIIMLYHLLTLYFYIMNYIFVNTDNKYTHTQIQFYSIL